MRIWANGNHDKTISTIPRRRRVRCDCKGIIQPNGRRLDAVVTIAPGYVDAANDQHVHPALDPVHPDSVRPHEQGSRLKLVMSPPARSSTPSEANGYPDSVRCGRVKADLRSPLSVLEEGAAEPAS
jgi:hypothetical protein